MQGDLISRSALISLFEEKMFNSVSMNPIIKMLDVLEIIEEQPTAYDVEKVVAELEEAKVEYENIFNRLKYEVPNQATYYLGLHTGCEISQAIVRNGGKE